MIEAWANSNIALFLKDVQAQSGVQCDIGKAGDPKALERAGASLCMWLPDETSGKIRECTALHSGVLAYFETSLLWNVCVRGSDARGAFRLLGRLMNALIAVRASKPGVEWTDGFRVNPANIATERGFLIVWPIRIWEPVIYEEYLQGHIETTATSVDIVDQFNEPAGSVP